MVRKRESKKSGYFDTSRTAVALQYDTAVDAAPKVVAKGQGYIAEKIVQIAQEHRVPLYVNPELTRLLYEVSLDKAVPVSLYEVVAELCAWVYRLDSQNKNCQKVRR